MTGPVIQTAAVDVFLALRHPGTGHVLFGLRAAHLYAGGDYNLVSGKAEPGESAVRALIREAAEEAGITLRPADVCPLGAVHTVGSDRPRIGLVFTATHDEHRHGPVVNSEPGKCDGLVWADPWDPPQPLEQYNAAAVALVNTPELGIVAHGWPDAEHRMRLEPRWLRLVQSGAKTVELRLADERRAALHPGHVITFSSTSPGAQVSVRIVWLRRFADVEQLLETVPASSIGGPGATNKEIRAAVDSIYGERATEAGILAVGFATK